MAPTKSIKMLFLLNTYYYYSIRRFVLEQNVKKIL